MHKIFVLEDDPLFRKMIEHKLSMDSEYEVSTFECAADMYSELGLHPQVVTLDLNLPNISGIEVMKHINQVSPDTRVIIVSGQEDVSIAVEVLKLGAYEYLTKDLNVIEHLWISVHKATSTINLQQEIITLRQEIKDKYNISNTLKGSSHEMQGVFRLIEKTINSNINVIINGETGTGKELVAKAIHFNSKRSKKPFVAINVSAIPEQLIESELFGYEKGAFTGAHSSKTGKLEEASGGTLFLDEIGEMDLVMQAKLLRVLQEMELSRLGSNEVIKLDFNLITATHKDLIDEVRNGNFREDLYYRLMGVTIKLPALRERGKDIILLAEHFIDEFCQKNQLERKRLSPEAKEKLLRYSFPGNVRELKAMMESSIVLSEDQLIQADDIPVRDQEQINNLFQKGLTLEEYNAEIVCYHLKKNQNNVVRTAKELNVGKSTIYRMINAGKVKV